VLSRMSYNQRNLMISCVRLLRRSLRRCVPASAQATSLPHSPALEMQSSHWILSVHATYLKRSDNILTRTSRSQEKKSPSRHARKCTICRRADRKDLEDAFLRWRDRDSIVNEFRLAHHSAIYRHAHATGLIARRKANLYTALEYIIEQAQSVKPTASAVITAVRICAQMDGLWSEPPEPTSSSAKMSTIRRPPLRVFSLQILIANRKIERDASH